MIIASFTVSFVTNYVNFLTIFHMTTTDNPIKVKFEYIIGKILLIMYESPSHLIFVYF